MIANKHLLARMKRVAIQTALVEANCAHNADIRDIVTKYASHEGLITRLNFELRGHYAMDSRASPAVCRCSLWLVLVQCGQDLQGESHLHHFRRTLPHHGALFKAPVQLNKNAMSYRFARLECLSRKELTENLVALSGIDCIVEIENFDCDFFHMNIFGNVPPEFLGIELTYDEDEDWKDCREYKRMKANLETKHLMESSSSIEH